MLDIVLIERPIRSLQEARATLEGYRKDETDGILSPRDATYNIPGFVLEASARLGIPSMFGSAFLLKDGGFASYGPSFYRSGRLAARQVDKIVKGANPGEIPVEVDEKLEFVVNLQVAKAMGIEIPREVLYQADRIIR